MLVADLSYGDLKGRVGRKLQILADTETLSAEDGELVEDALLSVQAALRQLGVVSLDVERGINEPYADPVAAMAAAQLVDEFQIPEPRRSQLVAAGLVGLPGRSLAERRLRGMLDGTTIKVRTTTDVTYV
jgi:hypothetical protein